MFAASVIISYYKNLPALELILLSLNNQITEVSFEVILSEDDTNNTTVEFINQISPLLKYPITHISLEDKGFNKCICLNRSIKTAKSEFLIFIDGDCIPHKKFIASYVKHIKTNTVLYGRRVMLSKAISDKILQLKSYKMIHLFNLIRYRCKRIEEGIYSPLHNKLSGKKYSGILLGCNMGINKKDIISINGFDEDYNFPGGGEDSDIEWRLKKRGNIEFVSLRHLSIIYHLWHVQRFDREQEIKSTSFMNQKIKDGIFFCKNGLQK
jgi:GT2 family glycosyltransferase